MRMEKEISGRNTRPWHPITKGKRPDAVHRENTFTMDGAGKKGLVVGVAKHPYDALDLCIT